MCLKVFYFFFLSRLLKWAPVKLRKKKLRGIVSGIFLKVLVLLSPASLEVEAFVSPLTKLARVFSLRIVQIKAEREFKLVTLYNLTVKK